MNDSPKTFENTACYLQIVTNFIESVAKDEKNE